MSEQDTTPAPRTQMTGHTPTPWAIRQENDDWEVYPLRDGPPKFGEWSAVATCHDQYDDEDEAKANAELIVAAVNAYAGQPPQEHTASEDASAIGKMWASMHEGKPVAEIVAAAVQAERDFHTTQSPQTNLRGDEPQSETADPDRVYFQFVRGDAFGQDENRLRIRKWDTKPFDGASEYVFQAASHATSAREAARQEAIRLIERAGLEMEEEYDLLVDDISETMLRFAAVPSPSPSPKTPALSEWSGWDESNLPWSRAKHQDQVCRAVFGPTWAMEDAAALVGFINRTWGPSPSPKMQPVAWTWKHPNEGEEHRQYSRYHPGFPAESTYVVKPLYDHAPPQKQMTGLPQDVISLVIAAREAFDTGVLPRDENSALDEALEAFSSRVPYENEPDVVPSPSPQMEGPADQIISQIEELFPNWRAYRDLVDCITCELHELRQRAEGK